MSYLYDSNPTSTRQEIINKATSTNCEEDDLIRYGFVKGWRSDARNNFLSTLENELKK